MNADERILKDPAPAILVEELADSSVNLKLRVWAVNENYWDLNFAMIEQVKRI